MCERSERVESPGTYITACVSGGHFRLAQCSYGPPFVPWWLSPGEGGMPLHDAVGRNCEKGATSENQSAGVKYMG